MIDTQRHVDLFKELCLINAPALMERDVVAFVEGMLKSEGFEVWQDDAGSKIGGNANNLIVKVPGSLTQAPKVFFSAHFDTVEPTAGLEIVEENGVLKTSGNTILGADDKGGMAPIIEAFRVVREQGIPHGDLYALFTCAEEIGLKGAEALEIKDLPVDFGFVLDTGPPVGTFVTRTATHDRLKIAVTGAPAHAGKDPEKGVSAIEVASRAIAGMRLGRIADETTANIGTISGGTATNVIPARCVMEAEARSTDERVLDEQISHMIDRFHSAAQEMGAKVSIEHERHYRAYSLDESLPVVQAAVAASRKLGFEPTLRTTLGGSDANVFNAKGVPTIVVATGMEKIHTHEEFIKINDLHDTARLVIAIIQEVAAL